MTGGGASLLPPEPAPTVAQQGGRWAVGLALLAVAVGGVWSLRFLVTPVVLAFLIRYCLQPLVHRLEDRGVPRGVAVGLCFGGMLAAVVGLVLAVWPGLEAWLHEAPRAGERSIFEVQLAARLDAWEAAGRQAYPNVDWRALVERLNALLEAQRRQLMETLPALALAALSQVGTLVLAPLIAFFLLLEGLAMHRAAVRWVPNRWFETVVLTLHRVDRQIASYLRGAAAESALVAVLLGGALWTLGMPSALLFACLYGVLNVIPLVGPILGASAGLVYALVAPGAPGLGVLALTYGAVYAVDALLINPVVVGRSLNLHPLTIILGISIGGGLAGILGMLVAIPTIAVAKAVAATLLEAHRRGQLRRVG